MTTLELIQIVLFWIFQMLKRKSRLRLVCFINFEIITIYHPNFLYHCQRQKIEMTLLHVHYSLFPFLLKGKSTSTHTVHCSILCPFFSSLPFSHSFSLVSPLHWLIWLPPCSSSPKLSSLCPTFSPHFHKLTCIFTLKRYGAVRGKEDLLPGFN